MQLLILMLENNFALYLFAENLILTLSQQKWMEKMVFLTIQIKKKKVKDNDFLRFIIIYTYIFFYFFKDNVSGSDSASLQTKNSSTNKDLQSLLSYSANDSTSNTIKIFNTDTNSFTNFSLPQQQQNSQQLQQQLMATPSSENDPLQQLFSVNTQSGMGIGRSDDKNSIQLTSSFSDNVIEEIKVMTF
jgi:hypothetical protein